MVDLARGLAFPSMNSEWLGTSCHSTRGDDKFDPQ